MTGSRGPCGRRHLSAIRPTKTMYRLQILATTLVLITFVSTTATAQDTPAAPELPRHVAPSVTEGTWVAPENFGPGTVPHQAAWKHNTLSELSFIWPMAGEIDHDHVLVGYMDHDSTSGIRDYMSNIHTYDGHNGVDMGLLTFREMDHGVPVFAAEAGVVSATAFEHPDRNTAWDPTLANLMNGAVIDHGGDIQTAYFHFRRNSVTVEVGEEVEAGQLLGYIGSSGFSDMPHLHFEVRNPETRTFIDPFEGTAHDGPSLWEDQPQYVGDDQMKVYNIGIATRESMGGDVDVFDYASFIESLSEPSVFGATDQEQFVLWFQIQNQPGDRYRVEIVKPDGVLWTHVETSMRPKNRLGTYYFYWNIGNSIIEDDYGVWQIRMFGEDGSGGVTRELYARTLEVAAETEWAPRFLPAGKSIRIDGSVQRDTLRMDRFTGDVTFHVIDQPTFVSVEQDTIIVFEGQSDQASRSAYFQVVATDQHARTDTMWYHVVDPTKPLDAIEYGTSNARIAGLPDGIHLSKNYPNPFSGATTIEFDLATAGHVRLQVFDVLGREIATVVNEQLPAGRHRVEWQSGDASNGLYLYRLSAGGSVETRSMVLTR